MSYVPVCWDFSTGEDRPVPVLPVLLRNPQKDSANWQDTNLKVDTGFTGAIGLPGALISALELVPLGQVMITTTAGDKRVPYFQVFARNDEWDLPESLAYAIETTRAIAGRSLLTGKRWLLNFESSKFCYLAKE